MTLVFVCSTDMTRTSQCHCFNYIYFAKRFDTLLLWWYNCVLVCAGRLSKRWEDHYNEIQNRIHIQI